MLSRLIHLEEEDEDKLVQLLKTDWFIRRQRMEEEETTTEDIILLRAEQFQIRGGEDIIQQIRNSDRREKIVVQQLQNQAEDTWETEGIVYHKGRIYIPPDPALRGQIMHNNHDPPNIGHPGQHRMTELIKRNYWWPSMRNEIKKYVKGCDSCQRNKVHHEKKAAPLHPLPTPLGPWEEITIDLIRPLPISEDKDAILVIVDRFSKMIRLIATRTNLSSAELAKIYRDEIWKLHGIPRTVVSD
jgi:hypothetical protein